MIKKVWNDHPKCDHSDDRESVEFWVEGVEGID
jgi:hypothetical protein